MKTERWQTTSMIKQTGEFDSTVLDALSYGAYDYLNSVANHTMNMRDDILLLYLV